MDMKVALAVTAVAAAIALPGCYESPSVTVYEPGVYKGNVDPLLEKQRSSEHQEVLRERFSMVQMDR